MRKYIFLITSTLVLITVISSVELPQQELPAITFESDVKMEDDFDIFIAKDHNGRIAIFNENQDTPFLVTEIYVKTLPLADQESLKIGIILDENYPLNKFLEDFTS